MPMKKTATVLFLVASSASIGRAAFHLYDIQEIYSNGDGSVQFVELFTTFDNQQFLSGHTLRFEIAGAAQQTFNFSTGPSPTGNRTLLIGTASLTALGVTPDFIIPPNFISASANGTINFAEDTDIVSIASLPFNGTQSLNGNINDPSPTAFSINAIATPRNHAGTQISIPEPGMAGAFVLGLAAMGLRRRR